MRGADKLLVAPRGVQLAGSCAPVGTAVPVLDQLQLGSCTANAGAGVVMAYQERAGHPFVIPSVLAIYYLTRVNIEGQPADADNGAENRDVMKALARFGAPAGALWPYDPSRFAQSPSPDALADGLQHRAELYIRLPTLDANGVPSIDVHRHCLAQGFGFTFGFQVPANMQTQEAADSGLVLYPEPGEAFDGGHAVWARAFDDEKRVGGERGAFLCRNSWSKDWGLGGDFWLPYRFFTDLLADDCWTLRAEDL
jgi:C1A family cysteine protease